MKIKTVYLSSRMRGVDDWNYPAFDALAEKLRGQGYTVFNPAELPADPCKCALEDFMRNDVAAVLHSDAIVMFGDWANSEGSLFEKKVAEMIGLPILDENMNVIQQAKRTCYLHGPHKPAVVEFV